MPACPSCGAENIAEARFCLRCGTSLPGWPRAPEAAASTPPEPSAAPPAAPAPPPAPPLAPSPPPAPVPPWMRHDHWRRHRPDIYGPLGFGAFLITLGIVFAANPALPGQLSQWASRIGTNGPFIRPPDGVISSAALLFAICGVAGLVFAGLRYYFERRQWRAIMNACSAGAALGFSYLLYLYAGRSISGAGVIGGAVVLFGLIIIAGALIGLRRHEAWWKESEPPGAPPT